MTDRAVLPLALTVSVAFLIETLDSTILIAALPTIAQDFGIDPLRVNLAVTIYLVTLAAMIPASSWLADRIGAKRLFLMAIALFMVASIGAAMSQNLGQLIGMRVLQAGAGAMMTPVGRLLLIRHTPQAQLATAIIWMTTPVQIGPVLGPLLGGWIVTYAQWPLIFLVNIPLGLIGLVFAWRVLPADTPQPAGAFDLKGFILCAVILSVLQIGIDYFVHPLLPAEWMLALWCAVPLAAWAYARHIRRIPRPALDLSLFRLRLFRNGLGWGVPARMGINAIPFLLQLQLQLGFGWSAARAGLVVFAIAGGAVLLKPFMGRILARSGFRVGLGWNAIIAAGFAVALGCITVNTPPWAILGLVLGFGMARSLQFNMINTIVFADVPKHRQSASTALAGVGQQLSMALGISVAAALVAQVQHLAGAEASAAISIAMFVMAALTVVGGVGYLRCLSVDDGRTISDASRGRASKGTP